MFGGDPRGHHAYSAKSIAIDDIRVLEAVRSPRDAGTCGCCRTCGIELDWPYFDVRSAGGSRTTRARDRDDSTSDDGATESRSDLGVSLGVLSRHMIFCLRYWPNHADLQLHTFTRRVLVGHPYT